MEKFWALWAQDIVGLLFRCRVNRDLEVSRMQEKQYVKRVFIAKRDRYGEWRGFLVEFTDLFPDRAEVERMFWEMIKRGFAILNEKEVRQ